MDWLSGMSAALAYIESNLAGKISYADAAKYVFCSAGHFQKVFAILCNVPLSEYIRKRRLSLAAHALQNSHNKIIDIAQRYGYDSPTAFARAFTAMHGIPPHRARGKGVQLKAYPPLSFHISVKGAVTMNYRVEELKPFRAVGTKLFTQEVEGENNTDIPKFWTTCRKTGMLAKLKQLNNSCGNPAIEGLIGICGPPKPEQPSQFDYYIAAATADACPPELEEFTMPAATYVVFETNEESPEAIQKLWVRIFSEWLPTSGYRLGNAADFEFYPTNADKPYVEIWVPVEK